MQELISACTGAKILSIYHMPLCYLQLVAGSCVCLCLNNLDPLQVVLVVVFGSPMAPIIIVLTFRVLYGFMFVTLYATQLERLPFQLLALMLSSHVRL